MMEIEQFICVIKGHGKAGDRENKIWRKYFLTCKPDYPPSSDLVLEQVKWKCFFGNEQDKFEIFF